MAIKIAAKPSDVMIARSNEPSAKPMHVESSPYEGPSIKVGSLKCKHNWIPQYLIGHADPVAYVCGFCAATKGDKAKKGRPASGKIVVTLRLDPDVVTKFKATGDGWQARMNDALKAAKV